MSVALLFSYSFCICSFSEACLSVCLSIYPSVRPSVCLYTNLRLKAISPWWSRPSLKQEDRHSKKTDKITFSCIDCPSKHAVLCLRMSPTASLRESAPLCADVSVVSGSAFLHAGSLWLGDVLVVGLVFQLSVKVLDRFVQTLFQRYLRHTDRYNRRWWRCKKEKQKETNTLTHIAPS